MCKSKRHKNQPAKPNLNAMRRAAVKERPYRLVPQQPQKDNLVPTLWGITVVSHVKVILASFYGYILLRMWLPIWLTFFPHISMMRMLGWMTCAVMMWLGLNILLFLKKQYEKRNDPIPWTRLPFFLPLILMVFAMSHGMQWQYIMDNAAKIADNRFWIESLKVAVEDINYGMQAMDDRISKQIEALDVKYTKKLEENKSVQKVEELASKMWEGFGLITITRQHFGLGCFAEGTLIQIDEFGTVVPVESLNRNGSMVFNPAMNEAMRVKVFTMGPEDDDVFTIVTASGYVLTVTDSHPIWMCSRDRCNMVRADVLSTGDFVETVNGLEKVMDITSKPGAGMVVYNVMLDMDADEQMMNRVLIANNITTGDLMVQSSLE